MAVPAGTQPGQLYDRLERKLHTRRARRRLVRGGLVVVNLLVVALVAFFVLGGGSSAAPSILNSNTSQSAPVNPLDQLSSADIAVTVARVTSIPEATAVNNQADSQHAMLAMASSSDSVATKPQVVATALKSRADIQHYTTVNGDTIASIAAKFGVTSNSIRWSNHLIGDTVAVNQQLVIPPVNGIVYTVKAGDTPASLASKYKSDAAKIIAFNDAELSGLKPGEQIVIPDGSVAAPAPSYSYSGNVAWGLAPIYGYNGYDYGYCTWYVASRISVPSNWGNASTWAYYAGAEGWTVSSVPKVGAIAQTPYAAGGEGHVAIVDAISPDGSQIEISDMNGLAGWGRVGTGWVPTSVFPHYIYH